MKNFKIAITISFYLINGLFASCFAASASAVEPKFQTKKNLGELERKAFLDLSMKIGADTVKQRFTAIKRKYPGFNVLNACVGSFEKEGAHDVAAALVNPVSKTGLYVVLLENAKSDGIKEVARYAINFTEEGIIPKDLEALCESRTELMRIVQDYSLPRPETPAASASIKPINYLDAVCVAPFDSPEEFICHAYSPSSKKFTKIGSWFND